MKTASSCSWPIPLRRDEGDTNEWWEPIENPFDLGRERGRDRSAPLASLRQRGDVRSSVRPRSEVAERSRRAGSIWPSAIVADLDGRLSADRSIPHADDHGSRSDGDAIHHQRESAERVVQARPAARCRARATRRSTAGSIRPRVRRAADWTVRHRVARIDRRTRT